MCGIVGLLAPEGGGHQERQSVPLQRSGELLYHRGPDDLRHYVGEGVSLAVARLSIIDLERGQQPLSNETGTIWIAFNGEIVNALELRAELQASGHQFRTNSDTETIVHAYEQWGDQCVDHLRGMFAFGLWDAPKRRLLLVRDRFGIKPLYYAQVGDRFAFASEIKPLFAAIRSLPRRANVEALAHLFAVGFIPAPLTAFDGIHKLPAAHLMVVTGGRLETRPYWRLPKPSPRQDSASTLEEASAQFMALLRDTVSAWRLSDVPVGSLLSGGVDSGVLAALLTEISGPIRTFHIGFAAASHDESRFAQMTAQAIDSQHHVFRFTEADFDLLPLVVGHLEEPQCSATSIPIYLLYRACRQAGLKVILTGEGADELLGGYHWFDGDRRVRPLLSLPGVVRRLLAQAPIPISGSGRRVLSQGSRDPLERYLLWHQVGRPELVAQLLAPLLGAAERTGKPNDREKLAAARARLLMQRVRPALLSQEKQGVPPHPFDQFLHLEAQTRMVDFINFEVDRMSMANSVEARPPFLDHTLWEFCAQLPNTWKLTPHMNKRLLRIVAGQYLPAAVAQRPKLGLASPHAGWWRKTRLPDWAEDQLRPATLAARGYFDPVMVQRLRRQHQETHERVDHSRLLMGVLTTQLWHEEMGLS
jgi:asparagine synthase (glutamine-hydrolysing)